MLKKPLYSYVRVKKLCKMGDIDEMARHAARQHAGRIRADADPLHRALAWRIAPQSEACPKGEIAGFVPAPDGDKIPDLVDLRAAYTLQQQRTGARVRRGVKQCRVLHLLVGVSPALVREFGGLHDIANPGNRTLAKAVLSWGKETFGEDAPIAMRLDVDEAGGAVVDLFVMPTKELPLGRKRAELDADGQPTGREIQPKALYVAPSAVLDDVAAARKVKRHRNWTALQDSWNEYARAHVDPRLKRGTRKKALGDDWLTPEAYGEKQDFEREVVQLKASRDETQAELAALQPALEEARRLRGGLPELRQVAVALRSEIPTLRADRDAARAERDRALRESAAATAERRALQDDLADIGPQLVMVRTDLEEARRQRDLARQEREEAQRGRVAAQAATQAARAELAELQPALTEARQASEDLPELRRTLDEARTALSVAQKAQADAEATTRRLLIYTRRVVRWLGRLLPHALTLTGELPPDVPPELEAVLPEWVAPADEPSSSSGPDGP